MSVSCGQCLREADSQRRYCTRPGECMNSGRRSLRGRWDKKVNARSLCGDHAADGSEAHQSRHRPRRAADRPQGWRRAWHTVRATQRAHRAVTGHSVARWRSVRTSPRSRPSDAAQHPHHRRAAEPETRTAKGLTGCAEKFLRKSKKTLDMRGHIWYIGHR